MEGSAAGSAAAEYVLGTKSTVKEVAFTKPEAGISYVVPQRLSLPADKAELSFRVKQVFKKAKLVVKKNGEVVIEKKRSVMLPGEMEKLEVPLTGVRNGDLITVEVEAEKEAWA